MSERDYNRQAARRQRISRSTLIVGVDVGKAFNAVGFMNKDGNVLGGCAKLYNDREGFEQFVKMIEGLQAKHRLRDVLVGMEPTGHYWRKLAYFAKEHGYEVRFVRTTALKHHREIDEGSSAKSDRRDALTIANITREGKYIDTVIEDGVLRQLRTLSKARERFLRYSVSAKNSLHAALDDYFPELHEIFRSMGARSLWVILEKCPFPEDVVRMETSTLQEWIARSSRKKAGSARKAKTLYEAAQKSIGVKQIGNADRYRLRMCLEEVKRTVLTLKDMDRQLKCMVKDIPSVAYLMSIPGIGLLSAAVFLGELGIPAHFHNARQIVKYAGTIPRRVIRVPGRPEVHFQERKVAPAEVSLLYEHEGGGFEQIFSGVLSPEIRDQEQGGSATQEERDYLRSGYQADQSDLCAVTGQTGIEDMAPAVAIA